MENKGGLINVSIFRPEVMESVSAGRNFSRTVAHRGLKMIILCIFTYFQKIIFIEMLQYLQIFSVLH